MVPTRQAHFLGALGLITLISWFTWSWGETGVRFIRTKTHDDLVIEYSLEHVQWLRDLYWHGVVDVENGTTISYSKLELEADVQKDFRPPLMQDTDLTFPGFREINSSSAFHERVPPSQRATVPVMASPPIPDASHIIFGISTLLYRVEASLNHFAHWASGTGARFLILIDENSSQAEIDEVVDKAKALDIDMEIRPSKLDFDARYTYLIKALHEKIDDRTRWAAVIDDDTFFPSTTNLLDLLKRHDSSKPQYVGGYSEDFFQMGIWGLMAYGGAGIFLSVPLLNELVPHYETCALEDTTGDRRIAQCIFEHTMTRLSTEPSLHQLDLRGDGSGFYEALRPQPVSVHHWKSWNTFPMDQISLVARMCGESCLFQTYRLANDWQLTNGISIVKYSHDRGPDDIRMEMTWENSGGQDQHEMFRHSLAPIKPRDPDKISYIMEKAFYDHIKDEVRQLYVRRETERKHVGVVEVIWRRSSE